MKGDGGLKNLIELSQRIDKYRLILYELTRDKDFSHPDVIKFSQKLDKEITHFHKEMQS
ncbi:aspartyl-phosphate phosphatase Spo0E family protein [Neobacillus cucumis]|uniref:aspartyl-phosphate phosphatase Spo0E family protein n=1 Tax=Neobacillus cucumis TaxID=1740721 RepID=UPI0028534189|nr:aspartyl-phosphate phosphatase Spo0E family protein [Neobacillus cucumis]MDR4945198.1 aspartyl-phosphate phosphatase Spo0E family protein [Neobacillus cucumis]